MLVEAKRTFRNLYVPSRSASASVTIAATILGAISAVFAALYLGIEGTLFLQLTACILIAPLFTFRSIASERENRSLDFLTGAPITPAQIIAGKFFAALIPQAVLILICCCANILAFMAEPSAVWSSLSGAKVEQGDPVQGYILANLLLMSSALFATSLTLFISSRSNRSMQALGIAITALIFFYAGLPTILELLMMEDPEGRRFLRQLLNPFGNLGFIQSITYRLEWGVPSDPKTSSVFFGHLATVTLSSLLFLFLASKSLPRARRLGFFS